MTATAEIARIAPVIASVPANYTPSNVVAIRPASTPVKWSQRFADQPAKICQAPTCENIIGAQGLTPRARKGRRFCCDECQRAGRRNERNTETSEYGKMTLRIVKSYGRRVGVEFDELGMLAEIAKAADDAMRAAVTGMRANGLSWALIGEQLGITRQAAQQRFGR